jgi:exosortase A-associated hydrolase 2
VTASAAVVSAIEAFYLNVPAGPGLTSRFCLYHAPPRDQAPAGLVIHVHAFAEEMNKSRRMAAIQSRAFAAAGWATLQIDLLGCGDSDGDFGDASWSLWVADVVAASRWLLARHTHAGTPLPLYLWGHRAGALIAVQAAGQLDVDANFLLWHPAVSGRAMLQQFLRLKTMADLERRAKPGAQQALRQWLAAGNSVDVAGYTLTAALAQGLEQAQLTPPPARAAQVVWLEMSQHPDLQLSPAALAAVATWRLAGHRVHAQAVRGPAFWQTVEIEDAPALVTATMAATATMTVGGGG